MKQKNLWHSPLPVGRAPKPLPLPHFPDPLHAVVWRNWDVVPLERLAETLSGAPADIRRVARSMGLPEQRRISAREVERNYMTVLHRNWHLLPYDQLRALLEWEVEHMRFMLNEDDFLFIKLGGYKPSCAPVCFREPDREARRAAERIARIMRAELGDMLSARAEPPFGFVERFAADAKATPPPGGGGRPFRMVYPYFLRYGEPLLGQGVEDLPEGYLAELARCGVSAIWLQGILNKLAPWELAPELSGRWEERLWNLDLLVRRCAAHDIEVLLYLNEPRAMPPEFFGQHPGLRGVAETPARRAYSPELVALCTSTPEVRKFLTRSVRHVFERVPGLGGVFAITFSENLTNCYSREYDHGGPDAFALRGGGGTESGEPMACPRCRARGPAAVHAGVCALLEQGMRQAGSKGKFLLYLWSTPEDWVPGIIEKLPPSAWVMCISEFGVPFTRGDHAGTVNEYSISVPGPSAQSLRQWRLAKRRGLKTAAKMQAANTFEFSSVPWLPALRLVAEHFASVARTGVDGIMLGWTAGGSPSPNLEIAAELLCSPGPDAAEAMRRVAGRRFGPAAAAAVVAAWNHFSDGFEEFPFDISVCYNGPQSLGPANLLHAEPTGFVATMVTFPFDDLDGWRGPYSAETLEAQFAKVAALWVPGLKLLENLCQENPSPALREELGIAKACHLHFLSTVNQIRFIRLRGVDARAAAAILRDEIELSRELMLLVAEDSRIGFEATNHYGYIRLDLAEKILNCRDLLERMK